MDEKYPYSVLFVEDEKPIRQNYITYLQLLFAHVYEASDGAEGYAVYREKNPDIMIIDINMPVMNGLELLKKVRQKDQRTKAVMLTAHTDTEFLLQASSLKLNCYLTKPIDRKELKRVLQEAIAELQTYRVQRIDRIDLGEGFSWEPDGKVLRHFGKEIPLTPKERKFLELLCSDSSRIFTYEEISIHVWGYDETGSTDSIKTLVKKLRKKLPNDTIDNVFATGYRLQ